MIKPTFLYTVLLSLIIGSGIGNPDTGVYAQIEDGSDVITAMHEKYQHTWYEYLTFEQETVFYGPGEEIQRKQTWYEAMHIPSKLAIKFDEKNGGNGILFRDNIQYGYANGQKIQEVRRVHELLVLGFDVYRQHPDSTMNQLTEAGYDLSKMYEDEWKGRPVYVVGTNLPDNSTPQFWIDKEHLYFVRSLSTGRQNTIQEVQFNKYERLGGGWIAPEVVFQVNGQKGLLEIYTKITIPDTISSDIFDPEKFTESDWH